MSNIKNIDNLQKTLPSSLQAYMRQIQKFPLLTAAEEEVLVKKWRATKDSDAAQRIVNSHLRLVVKLANGYRGYGLPISDLVSEGSVGIMQALERFDPDNGFRFSTYASWWIHANIKEYILRSWSLVRIGTTAAQKKLFFRLRKVKSEIQKLEEQEGVSSPDTITKIAQSLEVSEDAVVEMEQRLSGDYSLNAPMSTDTEGEWIDSLEDNSQNQETVFATQEELDKRRDLLEYAMEFLSPKEVQVFKSRHLSEPPTTLKLIAQDFNLSRERIRQIELQAFKKVKRIVQQKAAEIHMGV